MYKNVLNNNIDLQRPVKLAEDVYWVGFFDEELGIQCNPYLIIDGEEGVLIDGGSRPDFPTVMMKVLQTGLAPGMISTLIYHHYDLDLCGSLPNMEDIINRPTLKILSHSHNNFFIRRYMARSKIYCIEQIGRKLQLKSGRTIRFIPTPFSHVSGSFMTYDEKSGILFSSDVFGSYRHSKGQEGMLFTELPDACHSCQNQEMGQDDYVCPSAAAPCPLSPMFKWHMDMMTSTKALRYALNLTAATAPTMLAPQHGHILTRAKDILLITRRLMELRGIGIDGVPDA